MVSLNYMTVCLLICGIIMRFEDGQDFLNAKCAISLVELRFRMIQYVCVILTLMYYCLMSN